MVRSLQLASLLLIALCLATPARALTAISEHAYYRLEWNGIPIGRIRVDAEESGDSYSMIVDTKSKGVISVFSPFRTVATISGTKEGDAYLPRTYRTRSEKNDECPASFASKHLDNCGTHMSYSEAGLLTERVLVPPNLDPSYRPIVDLAEASTGTDPITGYFRLREKLRRNIDQGMRTTTVRTYDGKRLADMTATTAERTEINVDDAKHPVIATRLTRKPIAGYTQKELRKFKEGDPIITAYFSDDDAMQLLRLELELTLGNITMELGEEP